MPRVSDAKDLSPAPLQLRSGFARAHRERREKVAGETLRDRLQQGLPMLRHREMCGPLGGEDKLAYLGPQEVHTEFLGDPHDS
jgi:hypothetical protein